MNSRKTICTNVFKNTENTVSQGTYTNAWLLFINRLERQKSQIREDSRSTEVHIPQGRQTE